MAVGAEAQRQGIARLDIQADELRRRAYAKVEEARSATETLMTAGIIAEPEDLGRDA